MPRRMYDPFDIDLYVIVGTFVLCLALLQLPYGLAIVFSLAILAIVLLKAFTRIAPYHLVGVLLGCIFLFGVSLLGFYLNAKIVGEFNNGGTWVPDHTLKTGLGYVLLNAPMFVAAFFGYDSNTTYGSNDSDSLLFVGILVSALVVTSGLFVWKYVARKIVRSKRLRPLL